VHTFRLPVIIDELMHTFRLSVIVDELMHTFGTHLKHTCIFSSAQRTLDKIFSVF